MTASEATPAIFGGLFSDPETALLFSDGETVRAMIEIEVALARVQAAAGMIPAEAAERIAITAAAFDPDLGELAAGTEATGGVTIPLIAQLRAAVGGEAAGFVHWGATSQDIVDTGLVLRLRRTLDLLGGRLDGVAASLARIAKAHRRTLAVARTRSQQAVPTTFGLKVANWLVPLLRHRDRLAEMRPRLLAVQLGGAAGTLAAMGDDGIRIMEALARELDLAVTATPWHTQRDAIAELAGWLTLVTATLGKLGQDIVLLSQSEVGEVREGGGGGSSTMPQKSNPVAAETLVALARFTAGLVGTVHQAALHELERGGAAWQLESMALPQMAVACGAALRHAGRLLDGLAIDPDRMRRNLDAANGLVLAEAASFALARRLPRDTAKAMVTGACREVETTGRHLIEVLKDKTAEAVDWDALADPANYLGAADAFVARVLKAAKE